MKLHQIILLFYLQNCILSSRLEYKFYMNFGQRFIDYSGSGFDGINGSYLCKDKDDAIITDRGIFMNQDNHQVTIPIVNSNAQLLFDSLEFSIALWIKITKNTQDLTKNIFIRFIDSNKYLRIFHDNYFQVEYYSSTLTTIQQSSGLTTDSWNFLGVSLQDSKLLFYINKTSQSVPISKTWTDSQSGSCSLGYNLNSGDSFQGFLFLLSIKLTSLDIDSYIGSEKPSCHRGTCKQSLWSFSVKIESNHFMISSVNTIKQDSNKAECSSDCEDSCLGDKCLDCECEFLSCEINEKSLLCYCGSSSTGDSLTCPCSSGSYFNGFKCQSSPRGTETCMFSYEDESCYLCNNPEFLPKNKKCVCSSKCTSNEICYECDSTCESCNKNKCTQCIDSKAKINESSPSSCYCSKEFYMDSGFCKSCHSSCQECVNGISCSLCLENMEFDQNNQLCVCKNGFYSQEDSCVQCDVRCASCKNETSCDACNEGFYLNEETGTCGCQARFFYDNSDTQCKECNANCASCEDDQKCLECLIKFAVPGTGNECYCDKDSTLSGNECKCLSNTYRDHEGNCVDCPIYCEECTLDSTVICTSCPSHLYFDSGSCLCTSDYYVNAEGKCTKDCGDKYEGINGTCVLKCGRKCEVCVEDGCTDCIENSKVVDGFNCECNSGYSGDKCEKMKFSANVKVLKNASVQVAFTQSLISNLSFWDFHIKNGSSYIDFNITYSLNGVYILDLLLNTTISTQLSIEITEIESLTGAVLFPTVYPFDISKIDTNDSIGNSTEKDESNSTTESKPEISTTSSVIANTTTSVTKAVISSSLTAAVASNPSSFWTFFNTLELISFLPINSIKYPDKLRDFIKSLGSSSMIPFPINKKLYIDSGPAPYKEAKEFGLDTSLFIVNTFVYIGTFTLFILAYPVLILCKVFTSGNIREFLVKRIDGYKFGFFIRFWIQGFLGITMMAGVQIKSWIKIEYFEIDGLSLFSFCLSFIIFAASTITPALVLIFVLKNKKLILVENEQFFKKYGSMYNEFKNIRGISKSLYYLIFFIRRILFIYSQIFLNEFLYLQSSLNLFGSCFCIIYLIIYIPFKDKITFFTVLLGELFSLEVTALSMVFIKYDDQLSVDIISDTIIYSILIMIALQFALSIFQLYKPIKCFVQRLFEKKGKIEAINTSSHSPEHLCVTSMDRRNNNKDISISNLD